MAKASCWIDRMVQAVAAAEFFARRESLCPPCLPAVFISFFWWKISVKRNGNQTYSDNAGCAIFFILSHEAWRHAKRPVLFGAGQATVTRRRWRMHAFLFRFFEPLCFRVSSVGGGTQPRFASAPSAFSVRCLKQPRHYCILPCGEPYRRSYKTRYRHPAHSRI